MLSNGVGAIAQANSALPDVTTGQKWTGIAIIIGMILAILYIWYRTRYVGLGPSNADAKDSIWTQLFHNEPSTLRIPARAEIDAYRSDLRELVADAGSGSVDKREATVSGALADVRQSAAQTYAPILEKLPSSAVRSVELAALVVVLGAPAVSTAAILELLQSDGGVSLGATVAVVTDATINVTAFGLEALTAFPYAGTLFAFGLTFALVTGEWLFANWYVTALLLIGGAAAVVVLDYTRTREYDDPLYADRRNLGFVAGKRVLAVWVAGVAPAVVFAGLGLEPVGALLGFLAALAVGAYYLQLSAREAYRRLVEIGQWGQTFEQWRETGLPADGEGSTRSTVDRALAGYLLARRVIVGSWVLVIPLVVAYVASGLSSGAYADVARAAVGAAPAVQVLLLACVLAPVAAVAYLGRRSVDDFVTGLRETWSRRRVRMAAFQRGVPVMVVVAVSAIVYSLTQTLWLAAVVAVVFGVVSRVIYELLMAAKYRVSMFDRLENTERSVLVEAYTLEVPSDDGDGQTLYYAKLNGSTDVLTDSPARFVDAVVDVYPDVSTRGDPTPTAPMWRARFALRYGILDAAEVETAPGTKLWEKVRKRAMRTLRDDEWAYRSDLEREAGELPQEHLESWLAWCERHGVVSVKSDASGDDVVLLKRDPWRKRRNV